MERYNPWWSGQPDQRLVDLSDLSVKWVPEEISRFSLDPFSMNFLSGPRQVGKTTLLKLLIKNLLVSKDPKSIFYYSCDELSDYKELGEVLDSYISSRNSWRLKTSFFFLDEVTFVDEWWRAIKSRIDNGIFKNDVLTLTGSASLDLMRQREHFPGRRGQGKDIVMRPLSFRAYVRAQSKAEPHELHGIENASVVENIIASNKVYGETLDSLFQSYLETGGFPLAIKEKAETGRVQEYSEKALLDGLRGDFLRVGRSEKSMKEVIGCILSAAGNPLSWLGIAKSTSSISSPNTARVYVDTLNDLLLTFELELLTPDRKVLHRKNRKVLFTDPFIYNVLSRYTGVQTSQPTIVEGLVASQLSRKYETYYWRNHTEVDVIAYDQLTKKQYGFEVKWGYKSASMPRHLSSFIVLNKENTARFLAALS